MNPRIVLIVFFISAICLPLSVADDGAKKGAGETCNSKVCELPVTMEDAI